MSRLPSLFARSALLAAFAATTLYVHGQDDAYVPIRVSIKFITDINGNRPAAGNVNTDDEILAEFDEGNAILRENLTEFQFQNIEGEIVDLGVGASGWYTTSSTNRLGLRAAAIADPATFLWRTNAINVYINNGTSSASASFPPDNDIVLMNQGCGNTPSCMLHEFGHNLNLFHTHQSPTDNCADTLPDDDDWVRDDMATNSFGDVYANLTPAQQAQIDVTFYNIMSYHIDQPQRTITPCQRDRMSTQAYSDLAKLLGREPVYVDASNGGAQSGSFTQPYQNVQTALDSENLNGKVLVLEQGSYTITQDTINESARIVPRSGNAFVDRGAPLHDYEIDFSKSANPRIRQIMRKLQEEDTQGRKAASERRKLGTEKELPPQALANAKKLEEKQAEHRDQAMLLLHEAEALAQGPERILILLELAQRYEAQDQQDLSAFYYASVAVETDQERLKRFSQGRAEVEQRKLDRKVKERGGDRPEKP